MRGMAQYRQLGTGRLAGCGNHDRHQLHYANGGAFSSDHVPIGISTAVCGVSQEGKAGRCRRKREENRKKKKKMDMRDRKRSKYIKEKRRRSYESESESESESEAVVKEMMRKFPDDLNLANSEAKDAQSVPVNDLKSVIDESVSSDPKRRVIGPEMPSTELFAAAAKLTEAQSELRDAELQEDPELFVGPPPPAMVTEFVDSSNEAERFEEVTRIMEAEANSPYDVLGVNHNIAADNIKKKYWKLSLLVHPDKCPHPQSEQAFVLLNKSFKELQDPEKRKAMDDEINLKEEQEAFKVELRAMREAAQWRRSQGISMEGDEELLAGTEVKPAPVRDEWMTTLPPERKPGVVTMHSTRTLSRNIREGRGDDTSSWTDTPLERAQKARMDNLQAYNEATGLASNKYERQKNNKDAELVDMYNKEKRYRSLVDKHRLKKNNKGKQESERQSVKFDSENMAAGLSSRFSSGNIQRCFL